MVQHCGLTHPHLLSRQRQHWLALGLAIGLLWPVEASLASAVAPSGPPSAASTAAPSASPSASAPPGGATGAPLYATRLPAAGTLDYALRRGLMRGTGQLRWSPSPEGYRMALEGTVFGVSVMNWSSEGSIDRHGLAPLRFTDQRLNRSPRVASFDRVAGRISYAGRDTVVPLPPGAQDRLSWMVQLPAVLLADPALQQPGRKVLLFVSGARGDTDVWTFEVQGRESLDLPAGRVRDALQLRRLTDEPGDTRAQAWLDPTRGLLPVRVRFSSADGQDVTEFLLSK